MTSVFRRLRSIYKKLRLRRLQYTLPFIALAVYTVIGASVFRHFELEPDEQRRRKYREDTEYAFNQVLNRIMEVHCEDKLLLEDQKLQARHTKDALFWLIDYLNLTQVLEERSESSPWTWPGAMFYAGQLYTTIGYGLPVAQTSEGRLASMLYIMLGIPLFLIILAQVGKLLSRALRKIYKRMRTAKYRLPDDMTRKMSEPVKAFYNLTPSLLSNGGTPRDSVPNAKQKTQEINCLLSASEAKGLSPEELNSKSNQLSASDPQTPVTDSSSPTTEELDPIRQNELNETNNNNRNVQQQQQKQQPSKLSKKDSSGSFPIPLALALLILWIAFSAAMFCLWETHWGYLTSVYFFFVSISTVGLGDIVPTKPDMMFINFMLILIGLALLSMCINLIQDALERLIEQLIEEYIDEIEKMAAVVTNNEEYAEEAPTPFEVGMTAEMLTVPLTTIAQAHEKPHVGGTWRAAKDWIAERIASNVLINRLDPPDSSDESSTSSDELSEDEDENKGVACLEDGSLRPRAKISTVSSVSHEDTVMMDLPVIEVHEGTPISSRTSEKLRDAVSLSTDARRNSRRRKRARPAGALSTFSKSTMRAIQAIETAKMRTYRDNNFKTRLFAKFATNERLARLVDDHIVSVAHPKMISEGCQTASLPEAPQSQSSPRMPPNMLRSAYEHRNFTIESMDSTSSEAAAFMNGNTDSIFDVDSLYSAGYFDMSFRGYSTESVPRLMAEPNTPLPMETSAYTHSPTGRRYTSRMNSLNSSASVDAAMTLSANAALPPPYRLQRIQKLAGTVSVPGSPPMALRLSALKALPYGTPQTPPIVGQAPRISLTECDTPSTSAAKLDDVEETSSNMPTTSGLRWGTSKSGVAPPTPTSSPTIAQKIRAKASEKKSPLPLLGCVPLYHRALSAKRRFSDNDCLSTKDMASRAALQHTPSMNRDVRLSYPDDILEKQTSSMVDTPHIVATVPPPPSPLPPPRATVIGEDNTTVVLKDATSLGDDEQHLSLSSAKLKNEFQINNNNNNNDEDALSLSTTTSDVISWRENETWIVLRDVMNEILNQIS